MTLVKLRFKCFREFQPWYIYVEHIWLLFHRTFWGEPYHEVTKLLSFLANHIAQSDDILFLANHIAQSDGILFLANHIAQIDLLMTSYS